MDVGQEECKLEVLRLKIVFHKDTRRSTLKSPFTYRRLEQMLERYRVTPGYVVRYHDDEGEEITISGDEDLHEAVLVMEEMGAKALKIYIVEAEGFYQDIHEDDDVLDKLCEDIEMEENVDWEAEPIDLCESVGVLMSVWRQIMSNPEMIASLPRAACACLDLVKNEDRVDFDLLLGVVVENCPEVLSLCAVQAGLLKPAIETVLQDIDSQVESAQCCIAECLPEVCPLGLGVKGLMTVLLDVVDRIDGVPDDYDKILTLLRSIFSKILDLELDSEGICSDVKNCVHFGVGCDMCGAQPIKGTRYKCSVCENYDLCEMCEQKGVHPQDHDLIKFKKPMVKFCHNNPFKDIKSCFEKKHKKKFGDCRKGRFKKNKKECTWRRGHSSRGKGRRKSNHNNSSKKVREARKQFDSNFVRDVNVMDGTEVVTGSLILKTWVLRNNGQDAWPEGTVLQFECGDEDLLVDGQNQFEAPNAKRNQCVDVSAMINAPMEPGSYRATFRLALPTGERFGCRYWVRINVVEEE